MARNRHFVIIALACGLAACGTGSPIDPGQHTHSEARVVPGSGGFTGADLAALRQATARFHQFAVAEDAEWNTEITGLGCFSGPDGGMGFHYANLGLLDDVINPAEPEALLYEPQKNGEMRLVGVEYIVPKPAWTGANPPQLYGQEFPYIAQFDVYGLHVWVWRENPSGMFAPWNPRVNCDHAPAP